MKSSAREAYNELYKYFGLRANDAYLSSLTGGAASTAEGNGTAFGEIFHALYGDDTQNPSIATICEKIQSLDSAAAKKAFCITPYTNSIAGLTLENLPVHNAKVAGFSEQGVRGNKGKQKSPTAGGEDKTYTIQQLDGAKFASTTNRVDAIQVFPCIGTPELADTDVITLFMSTINSVNMSMAVPYVDVLVTTEGEASGSIAAEPFSFGNFLGASNDSALSSKFSDSSMSGGSAGKGNSLRAVASMEIFTTPQTLVNATPENVKYNENVNVGRHIDVFRPYLAIESISFNVVPANAGLIAFKTANMKIRLFDRGRLSSIAPIVAPSRFGLVKFDIEYGWSHPGGRTKVGRPADAQGDRIGQLIDSMRVTESYQVVNSNFSFEQDGSVSIDLKLSMLGRKDFSDRPVKLSGTEIDSAELAKLLHEIQKTLSRAPKSINVPSVLTGGVDTLITMSADEQKKIRKFMQAMKSKGGAGGREIAGAVAKLIGEKPNAQKSEIKQFQANREKLVNDFIVQLKAADDPFLRTKGLATSGVTEKELTGSQNFKFASFGSVIISAIGPILQDVGDVIFIFNCFNKNAGAMFDHNIAQFPIRLETKSDKEVTLSTAMKKFLKKKGRITPEELIGMLNDTFLAREDAEAYGLSELYKDSPVFDENDQIKEQRKKGLQADSEKPQNQLQFENKKVENLKTIYGESNRNSPTFTTPRITIKLDVKPSDTPGKSVVRVIVFDQAATNVGDVQEIFEDITSVGFFMKESYASKGKDSVRSAQHNELSTQAFKLMEDQKIIEKFDSDAGNLLKKLQEAAGNNFKFADENGIKKKLEKVYRVKSEIGTSSTALRDIFYKLFPTIIYGSMGSGIINAQLSSNQNDALTTISLQRQENENPLKPGLPMLIHPTQLTLDVFGTPMFKYSQKFFIDFGTGTSADNFYVVTGVDMNFSPGEFKTSLKMTQLDVFGRFMKTEDTILKTLLTVLQDEEKKK